MLDGRVLGASQVEYKPFGKPPLKKKSHPRMAERQLDLVLLRKQAQDEGIEPLQLLWLPFVTLDISLMSYMLAFRIRFRLGPNIFKQKNSDKGEDGHFDYQRKMLPQKLVQVVAQICVSVAFLTLSSMD